MGRPRGSKSKQPNGETEARPGRNGFDPKDVQKFVGSIMGCLAHIGELHASIAGDVASLRADIKDSYEKAKDAGIPIKALKAAVKVKRIEAAMEQDVADDYDQIRHALGDLADTPLGRAATGEEFHDDTVLA
jgi:uncharacterized protein (UPF0335 family)